MTPHFINLNCTNCGAKPLDVHDDDDMERFACGYCGTEIIVQRRGGTVALKALTAAIIKVQTGTDKTAAELALARYEKEIAALGISRADLPSWCTPSARRMPAMHNRTAALFVGDSSSCVPCAAAIALRRRWMLPALRPRSAQAAR